MNENERDNLTENEAEEVESGAMDAEESHRYGEFEELRGLIEGVRDMLTEVKDMVATVKDGMGMFVENGATVQEETAGDGVPDAVESTRKATSRNSFTILMTSTWISKKEGA